MTKEEAIEMLKKDKEQRGECFISDALDMAIKALKQGSPCEDAVSKKDMYFKLTNGAYPNETIEQFIDRLVKELEDMPPVKPTQRWIPVSERLPEENGFYLATCDGEICGENEPFTGLAEYENGKWVDDEEDYQCVLAWMPLPKAYKAESEE